MCRRNQSAISQTSNFPSAMAKMNSKASRVSLIPVQPQKFLCCKERSPFVAVHKWMVSDDGMHQSRCFLFKGRVKFLPQNGSLGSCTG